MLFDDVLARRDPDTYQSGQLVAYHAPAKWREVFNVGYQEPARNVRGLADSLLGHRRAHFIRNLLRLPKGEGDVADRDLVHIAKPDRLMDAALVEERYVAADEITERKL